MKKVLESSRVSGQVCVCCLNDVNEKALESSRVSGQVVVCC
jgi:hypothetical protein